MISTVSKDRCPVDMTWVAIETSFGLTALSQGMLKQHYILILYSGLVIPPLVVRLLITACRKLCAFPVCLLCLGPVCVCTYFLSCMLLRVWRMGVCKCVCVSVCACVHSCGCVDVAGCVCVYGCGCARVYNVYTSFPPCGLQAMVMTEYSYTSCGMHFSSC